MSRLWFSILLLSQSLVIVGAVLWVRSYWQLDSMSVGQGGVEFMDGTAVYRHDIGPSFAFESGDTLSDNVSRSIALPGLEIRSWSDVLVHKQVPSTVGSHSTVRVSFVWLMSVATILAAWSIWNYLRRTRSQTRPMAIKAPAGQNKVQANPNRARI